MLRRHLLFWLTCLLVSMATLSGCATNRNQENAINQQTAPTKQSEKTGLATPTKQSEKAGQATSKKQIDTKQATPELAAKKNWNEASGRLPKNQHTQQVKQLSAQFPAIVIRKGPSSPKRVALTFDDGPDNYYTPRILNILQEKGVKATFFIVGKEAKRFPAMVKRIADEGNALGNHSWDHPKFSTLSNEQIKEEIISTQDEIQRITGKRTTLLRPPYGLVTPADVTVAEQLGYRVIDWSVDTEDWRGTSATGILQNVYKEISPGGIILEHCLAGHPGELNGTLQALPQIIDRLKAQGYQFVTVPELVGQ